MPKQDINYNNFQWHFGVVEDRKDPLEVGRVKVRFYGVHSDKLSEISTEELPWATVILPPSSPGVSGVGGPISGLVEGAWVIGFFIDEGYYQKPMVLGAIPGIPRDEPQANTAFNDPTLTYPRNIAGLHEIGDPDNSYLARGKKAEEHVTLKKKRESKTKDVPIAFPFKTTFDKPDGTPGVDYENKKWNEPDPRGVDKDADPYPSEYPLNHVFESEMGTVLEIDDTPGGERIHKYHKSGSFEEIQPDGTRVQKIVGKDYEISAKGKNVLISGGNLNITVDGDVNLSVKGNKIERIEGHHYTYVKKNKVDYIGGNHTTEITSDRGTIVKGNNSILVEKHNIDTTKLSSTITRGDTKVTVTGTEERDVLGKADHFYAKTYDLTVRDVLTQFTSKTFNLNANEKLNIISTGDQKIQTSANQLINVAATQTITADTQDIDATTGTLDYNTGSIDVVSGNITDTNVTLHTHTHLQTGGTAPDGDGPNNKQTNSPTDGT